MTNEGTLSFNKDAVASRLKYKGQFGSSSDITLKMPRILFSVLSSPYSGLSKLESND
jgi:hypothetical protein